MNNKSLTKNLGGLIVGFSLLTIVSIFLPIFVCKQTLSGESTSIYLNVIEILKRILDGKITDIQLIVFACLHIFVVLISFNSLLLGFNIFKNGVFVYKKLRVTSILMIVVSIVFMSFCFIISQQQDVNELLAEMGTGGFNVGVVPYLLTISSIVMLIISFIKTEKQK